jgi:L-ectoine synthase
LHETTIHANTETRICYRHHLEAVYCVGGTGEIVELAKGARHPIADGTMYLLNEHDDHLLRAFSELRLICVFTPPLRGRETHDERGAYPPHPQAAYYELARKA